MEEMKPVASNDGESICWGMMNPLDGRMEVCWGCKDSPRHINSVPLNDAMLIAAALKEWGKI